MARFSPTPVPGYTIFLNPNLKQGSNSTPTLHIQPESQSYVDRLLATVKEHFDIPGKDCLQNTYEHECWPFDDEGSYASVGRVWFWLAY